MGDSILLSIFLPSFLPSSWYSCSPLNVIARESVCFVFDGCIRSRMGDLSIPSKRTGRRRREEKKNLIPTVLHFSLTRSKTEEEEEKKKKSPSRESIRIPEKHLLIVTEGAGQVVPYINCATARLPFPTRR
ncbi:hypothetical protein HOY80DRAFT_983628, partial [Tuber brumale]